MERKNEKSSSSSRTPNEQQQSPQRAQGSTQRQPPPRPRVHEPQPPPPPRPRVQEPHLSRGQGGSSSGGIMWAVGGMRPVNPLAIPAGGSASDAASSTGGFVPEAAASRKRAREVSSQGTVGAGGRGGRELQQLPFVCSVCGRGFRTDKSLFGHMRTHGGRPWKGALPPPVFSREEFADTGLLNPVGLRADDEEGQGEQEVDQQIVRREPPAATSGEASNLNVSQRRDREGPVQYRVPDLNQSPPEEGNGNDKDN